MQHPGILSQRVGVIAHPTITERDMEHAIRPEEQMTAPVIRQRLLDLQHDALRLRHGGGGISRRGFHLADDRAPRVILRVAEVEEAVRGELRMKGDAMHAFLEKQDVLHALTEVEEGPPGGILHANRTELTALHRHHLFALAIGDGGEHDGRVELALEGQSRESEAGQVLFRNIRRRDDRRGHLQEIILRRGSGSRDREKRRPEGEHDPK